MKKFLRIVLVLVILVGLWFLAHYAARTGPVRRHFADDLAEALGADAVAVESTTLEFPFTFVARGVKATLASPEATVFEAPEIRASCCSWRVESPTVVAVAKPDGGIVPSFFASESARASLDGSGRPCPVGLLSTVADAWELPSRKFTIRKADVGYRDLDGGVHAVFTGLTWTKRPVCLGKHGRVGYSVAKWTSFGPAAAASPCSRSGGPSPPAPALSPMPLSPVKTLRRRMGRSSPSQRLRLPPMVLGPSRRSLPLPPLPRLPRRLLPPLPPTPPPIP